MEETTEERRRRLKREANARWRAANPERTRELNRKASRKTLATEEGRAKAREYFARQYATIRGKEYQNQYQAKRKAEDLHYKLSHSIRARIHSALKKALAGKSGRMVDLLGTVAADYKHYLEGLFEPGMTWENWGDWHIDHIRPLASFDLSDPSQQRAAFHYLNTRPSWASENLSKGSLHDGQRWRHGDHG